ncbi:amino acid/amide ABC transporter substrate-binding protein (HAAT family) [Antricoccus suffuscus]|uniref:Amino acid/amide ABC transporter substrate-binding protein (HAAT family) n=1 Tax=Antricoccus suffuscus TaxID=1629062 RepID=A0A2T0ZW46_9ACTN|nr:branched-chain amino acid ABC transporter substrate-binding protein [Antricoccus suffuscus]PRZ40581.1 amino acid/amide ABC transporter substrate-binding protein (HAAT family) [Antricoccus suffuscus]
MVRRPLYGAVAACAILAVVATGCGEKKTNSSSSSGSSGTPTIQPLEQITKEGKKVPEAAASTPADPAGDGKAKCSGVKLGFAGAQTGDNAALGINILNGMKTAVDKHNKANPDCQVEIAPFDTEGTPEKATQVAPSIVQDNSVIGLLGPAFSGESKAVDDQFNQAGLVSVTASATNPDLAKQGWKTFFRGLANDAVQGPAVAAYIKDSLKAKKVCVVKDDSDYGIGLAKEISDTLGSLVTCNEDVKTKQKEFSAVVNAIKSANVDVVFYSGYYAEASPFVQQLRQGGVKAKFMSADGVKDPEFVKGAGSAAKGAILSCPCGPADDTFAKSYGEATGGKVPGTYSVEGYDLATIMLKGIDSGAVTRPALLDYVKSYDGDGIARHYKWDNTGELAETNIWIYEVK